MACEMQIHLCQEQLVCIILKSWDFPILQIKSSFQQCHHCTVWCIYKESGKHRDCLTDYIVFSIVLGNWPLSLWLTKAISRIYIQPEKAVSDRPQHLQRDRRCWMNRPSHAAKRSRIIKTLGPSPAGMVVSVLPHYGWQNLFSRGNYCSFLHDLQCATAHCGRSLIHAMSSNWMASLSFGI